MAGARVCYDGSLMWLVPPCVAMAVVCSWLLRVSRWHLDVVGAHVCGGGSCRIE